MKIISDIFQASLISYLIILLISEFKPGFFDNYINIHWLWFLILPSGILYFALSKKLKKI